MISRIDLKQFKCFTSLRLPLYPLTLLSGSNASGKSSVLHALILLHQAIRENTNTNTLMLNGPIIQLGTVLDVVNQIYGRGSFEVGLEFTQGDGEDDLESEEYTMECKGERTDRSMEIIIIEEGSRRSRKKFRNIKGLQKLKNLTYLTAERLGPRQIYDLVDIPNDVKDQALITNVGPRGEYTASVLLNQINHNVLHGLCLESEDRETLWAQVHARMSEFFPEFDYQIEKVPHVNAVTLGLRTSKDTEFHSPANTGFGLTQVLPIVVAALSSDLNDVLLIENPEVHLHPAGQAAMGEFLAEVAAAGVQVILETHSDHILNGIRRAIKDRKLPSEDAVLYFLRPQNSEEMDDSQKIQHITINDDGSLDDWPEGFFDQIDKDLNYFAGWS